MGRGGSSDRVASEKHHNSTFHNITMDNTIALTTPTPRRSPWRRIAIFLFAGSLTAPAASAATLADLFAGATIDAGNARFSNWHLASLDASGASPNFALINVTPLASDPANPGLQFSLNNQLATTGLNAIDLAFSYRVQAKGGGASFTSHSLNLGAVAFGGPGGLAFVSQNPVLPSGVDGGVAVAIADNLNDVSQPNATASHAPLLSATVNVNIFLQGTSTSDAINLSTFTQRFTQNGATPIAGDFNNDQIIDGADFLAWQRNATPGLLTQANLIAWRTNYGQSIAAVPAIAVVPEPGTCLLLLSGIALLLVSRRTST